MNKNILILVALTILIFGCQQQPKEKLSIKPSKGFSVVPIQPEDLFEFSNEKVSFSLDKIDAVKSVTDWIKLDKPTNAELSCDIERDSCQNVKSHLNKFQIPYKFIKNGNDNKVVLVYDKVVIHECYDIIDSKYYMKPLGCVNSSNMLRMVNNYRQFVTSAPLEDREAGFATQNYNNLYNLSLQNME